MSDLKEEQGNVDCANEIFDLIENMPDYEPGTFNKMYEEKMTKLKDKLDKFKKTPDKVFYEEEKYDNRNAALRRAEFEAVKKQWDKH